MITSDLTTKNDPSIAELGDQLDAFVASIQARLQDIAEMDMPRATRPASESSDNQAAPSNQLTVMNQPLDERIEFCNGS